LGLGSIEQKNLKQQESFLPIYIAMDKQAPQNYVGIAEGTRPFRMKSMKPEEKEHAIKHVNLILDSLDEIQGLIGLKEYTKQLAHWQANLGAIENEF
jgi:hypothetical protein